MPSLERVYAEALFKAVGESKASNVYSEIAELSYLCGTNKDLEKFLENPVIPLYAKKEALNNIISSDSDITVKNFIFMLIDNKRIEFLHKIVKYFYTLLPENKGKLFIKIFTAKHLDEKIINEVKEKYAKLYGCAEIEAEIITDSSLLGGICVQIGDMRYDGTLKTKIKNLKETLT